MAFTGHKAWYMSSVGWTAVTAWATNTAKVVGDLVRQNAAPTANNERVFVCVVAGTTHATTEPTWTVTRGAKTTDNTVTWQEVTGIAALNGDKTNTPNWTTGAKNTAISIGHVIMSGDGTKILICDTAGTAGNGAEPTWNAAGVTTADNTVTWRTLKDSSNSFANWAAPHSRMNTMSNTNWGDTGTLFFCASNHDEGTLASATLAPPVAIGLFNNNCKIMSVNPAGAVPPGPSDLQAGALLRPLTGNVTVGGFYRAWGITYRSFTSGNVTLVPAGASNKTPHYENCRFEMGAGSGGGTGAAISHTQTGARYKDCVFKFASSTQGIAIGLNHEMDNCSMDGSGTQPANLFGGSNVTGTNPGNFTCRGCDWSAFTGTSLLQTDNQSQMNLLFEDCKINSTTWNGTLATIRSNVSQDYQTVTFVRCGPNANEEVDMHYFAYPGTLRTVYDVTARSGAQSFAGTAYGWKMFTTANANQIKDYLHSFRIARHNTVTGASKTVTILGVANTAAMPTNDDIWIDVQYLGDGSSPKATLKDTRLPTLLTTPSALTADSSTVWTDNVPARQNSHAYVLGDVIKPSGNSGRVFFCTTAGTTAGSEPGGYTSATDGSTPVTDGSAAFRAGMRFSISCTLTTPNIATAGFVYVTAYLALPSFTMYIDPSFTLT